MTKKFNKYFPAGFWIRFFGRGIDLLLISIISYFFLFFIVTPNKKGGYEFKDPILFYIWTFLTIVLFLIFLIAIPIKLKGQSIGYKLCKIKIISTNNMLNKSIIQRETFFAFGWIATIVIVTSIINHTLIFQIAQIKAGDDLSKVLTPWQKARISVTGSLSGIITLIQMIIAITIIPNKMKQGFHDKNANALVVWTKKTKQNVSYEKKEILIEPRLIKKEILNFRGEWDKNDIEW